MKLIEPTMEYEQQIQAYRQEFLAFGGSMDGCGSLRKFERTQDWIEREKQFSENYIRKAKKRKPGKTKRTADQIGK